MAGINYSDNIGNGYGYGNNGILDIAALRLAFDDKKDKCGCCAPATCEQVNDCDRDVLTSASATQREICDSSHKIEKDIRDTDKDVLLGFKDTDHKIDAVKCELKEGFAEVKGLIKETSLCAELRDEKRYSAELARKLEKADSIILKKEIVEEVLSALDKDHR